MKLMKCLKIVEVHGTTLTSNEMKNVIKVIKSLENRGILLQGTPKKVISQENKFGNWQFFWTITKSLFAINENILLH